MGREIRRVPPDWEHPRHKSSRACPCDDIQRCRAGEYMPTFDQDYESAANEWLANFKTFMREHKNGLGKYGYFWEEDSPPARSSYRERKWTDEEATAYQVYETVSEGCPVTPVFKTTEELIQHLVTYGDEWDQKRGAGGWSEAAARKFVEHGSAPSLLVMNNASGVRVMAPRDQDI